MLVHLGQADVANTENVFVNSWIRWLTLFNQWMLIRHLTKLVHKDLASSPVDAFGERAVQVHARTEEKHAFAVNNDVP